MSPRIPHMPDETLRFFARVDRFTCECPRCGQIIQAHFDRNISRVRQDEARKKTPTSRSSRGEGKRLTYNPLSSRLTCTQCRRTFGVGLLLYPVEPRATGRQPPDTRPTSDQLLEIRRLSGGFLVKGKIAAEAEVNLAIENSCTCPDRGTSRHCPVHGWPELREPSAPPEETTAELDTMIMEAPGEGDDDET